RPTSAHNVSTPTPKAVESHNYLSVPGARSRRDSPDSEDVATSNDSVAGETAVGSSPSPTAQAPHDTSPNAIDIIRDDDALKPDPGTEDDFVVEDNRFAFSPGQLNKMIDPKSLAAFYALGG